MSNIPPHPQDDDDLHDGDLPTDGVADDLDAMDDDETRFWEEAYLKELGRPDPLGERQNLPKVFLEQTEAAADEALRSRRTLDIVNAPYMWPGAYAVIAKKDAIYVGIVASTRGDVVDLEEARRLTSDPPVDAATYAAAGPAAGTTIGPTVGIMRIIGVQEILICSDDAAVAFDGHEEARTSPPPQGRQSPPAPAPRPTAATRPARRG